MRTHGENQAIAVAEKYRGDVSDQDRVKWLAGEVTELARAIENNDQQNIQEEIADCAYILCHLLSRHDPQEQSIVQLIVWASEKMLLREEL